MSVHQAASCDLQARSGISELCKRLGSEPVACPLRKTGHHNGCEPYGGDSWQSLQVLVVDGALLRTPDSPELRDHFGSGNISTEWQTSFPILNLSR